MTDVISIKESKVMRRIEVSEVVDIIEGPITEEHVGVPRVHARCMKDGLEGWITVAGNQGTVFLRPGGDLFRVAKETALTISFELDIEDLEAVTRTLKVGELVELREWPRRDDKSGLMRMRGRCRSDGRVGWIPSQDSGGQGTE